MLTLSKWANRNPVKSRSLIVIGHLLAVANALLLGLLLFLSDWPASSWLAFLIVNVFFVAYLYYPTKTKRVTKKRFWQQKRIDFTLAICYSLMIALSLNSYLATDNSPVSSDAGLAEATIVQSAVFAPPATAKTDAPVTKAEHKAARRQQFKDLKLQFKELKTELRAWKKEQKGQKKGRGLGNALLIFLVVALAVGLALLLASLSCSLSCSGQGALAVVLMLAGLTGVVWLSVIAIKAISRRKGKEPVDGVFAR